MNWILNFLWHAVDLRNLVIYPHKESSSDMSYGWGETPNKERGLGFFPQAMEEGTKISSLASVPRPSAATGQVE